MIRSLLTRREFIAAAAVPVATGMAATASATRSFWLFSLLRPACVMVSAVGTARLHCTDSARHSILEGREALCMTKHSSSIRITGPDGAPVTCLLEVPGLIRRSYFGVFEIRADAEFLVPIVTMDCETATSCIVGAELPVSAAPFHALAAQAVVSRSVLFASYRPRHTFADFCDTTHCQFLRSPAQPRSATAQAVQQTSGSVLLEGESLIPARYSAACGGHTEAGSDGGHSYVSVPCQVCRKRKTIRRGHGWGLCQEGAVGLAQCGFTWRAILAKYYPNASPVTSSPT